MNRPIGLVVWFICTLFVALPSYADAFEYFRARVAVQDQSKSQRNLAAKEGLAQVLTRVSGVVEVGTSPNLQAHMAKASSYIDQFKYELERDQWGDKKEYLSMTFSPRVIENMLQNAGLPFWPINRPKVLVWLVEDQADSGKQLVNDGESPVVASLQVAAIQRGVPLVFPLLDLDDQLAMSPDSLWELDEQAILDASERYSVDTVLVGRYTQTSAGQWWATWQFFHRGESHLYDLREENVEQLGLFAMAPLADYLSGLYAIKASPEGAPRLIVQIDEVYGFADYRGVMNYLASLAAVRQFSLDLLSGSSLLLSVDLTGELEQFNNAISLDEKLRGEEFQASPQAPWMAVQRGTPGLPLVYHWLGQ